MRIYACLAHLNLNVKLLQLMLCSAPMWWCGVDVHVEVIASAVDATQFKIAI